MLPTSLRTVHRFFLCALASASILGCPAPSALAISVDADSGEGGFHVHHAGCGHAVASAAAGGSGQPQALRAVDRWTRTATDGGNIRRGDAITLTWSFMPDGTAIPADAREGQPTGDPSDLIGFLDTRYAVPAAQRTSDLTQRVWFSNFSQVVDRWSAVSGLSFEYEPADDGVQINRGLGFRGTRGDIRIGGHFIDGQSGSNTLAYNFFPDSGDMVIDTSNTGFYAPNARNDNLGMRNVIAHEIGHGLGLAHTESNNSRILMEPSIQTSFDGPQLDDVLGVQRNYGDRLEKSGGNDTAATATAAGRFAVGDSWSIGLDAGLGTRLEPDQVDLVSIDGDDDADLFAFTITEDAAVDALLTPEGATYNESAQNGVQAPLNTSALADLSLELLTGDGSVSLGFSDFGREGDAESLLALPLVAGDYLARIASSILNPIDRVQLYSLNLAFAAVPEPSAALLLAAGTLGLIRRRAA